MPSTPPSRNGNIDADILKQYGGLNIGYAVELLEQDPSIDIDSRKITMRSLKEVLDGKVKFERTDSM